MTSIFEVAVPGVPVGQGSMKHIGNGRMIASNDKKLKEWRQTIIDRIHDRFLDDGLVYFDSAMKLECWFMIPRPKTVKRALPVTPYDLDKLIRAVGDACTQSGLISDDAIFTDILASKRYAAEGEWTGVFLRLSVIES